MNAKEIIELVLGSGGLISILILVFRMGKVVQKIEELETSSEKNFSEIKSDIKQIRTSINSMEVQIGKLETRVEERTLRVVKDNYKPEPAMR